MVLRAGLIAAALARSASPALAQDLTDMPPAPSNSAPIPVRSLAVHPVGWKGAFADSFRLLMLEHAGRIAFQAKTRRELGGSFVGDYRRSLSWPTKWGDGDGRFVNYFGHPLHGAAAGRTWINNDPQARGVEPSLSRRYWISRAKAMGWSALYSLQFEVGPLSEASIGNVGMNKANTGWVDHVVTPLGALAFIVAEDALDRFVVTLIERETGNRALRATARVALNPSRALANIVGGRTPWFRARGSLDCCR